MPSLNIKKQNEGLQPIQHRRERYQCSVEKKNRRKNGKKFFCVKEIRTADLWVAHPWIKEPTGTTLR